MLRPQYDYFAGVADFARECRAPHFFVNFASLAAKQKESPMNIKLHEISVRDLVSGYADSGAHFELSEMEADHITPWRDGGRTIPANCQMLCRDCNRRKGAK